MAGIGLGIVYKSGRGGGRYWGEVGAAVHLFGQRNRLKAWKLWCRVLLVDSCSCVLNQGGVLYQNPF